MGLEARSGSGNSFEVLRCECMESYLTDALGRREDVIQPITFDKFLMIKLICLEVYGVGIYFIW